MFFRLYSSANVFPNIPDRDEADHPESDTATHRKQSEGLLAKIILIRVGEAQELQIIPVHRQFLCKDSYYFRDAFEADSERSSFDFPEQEPEMFERAMNWIYGGGFLLPKDNTQIDETEWFFTQASDEAQNTNGPAGHLVVEHGPGVRQSVTPTRFTKLFDIPTGSDFSDNEQETRVPGDASTKTEAPTPLDTMTLSKIYALAEFLQMKDLCNEIIELLGQRLGYDNKTPGQALTYAFERCGPDSPLRKLLIDFTALSAPIYDVLHDPAFEASPALWRALVGELARVRGGNFLRPHGWEQNFGSSLGEYRV